MNQMRFRVEIVQGLKQAMKECFQQVFCESAALIPLE